MGKRTVTIQLTRGEYIEDGNARAAFKRWHSVPDGTLTGTVELRIDVQAILERVGRRALRAKGKRSQALGGAVEVVVDRTTLKREGAKNA